MVNDVFNPEILVKKGSFQPWCLKEISLQNCILHSAFFRYFRVDDAKHDFSQYKLHIQVGDSFFSFCKGQRSTTLLKDFVYLVLFRDGLEEMSAIREIFFLPPPRKILGGGQNNSRERGGKFFFTHLRKLQIRGINSCHCFLKHHIKIA